jgi:S-adenosylmethionine hydrolase
MTHPQQPAPPLITLTTDFGQQDGYVGAMQGVILSICPTATIVHLSHSISPQNINTAAFILYQTFQYYPAHTVHCVVVDPGVGSKRRAIAVRTDCGTFVGPDNGVFSLALRAEGVNTLEAVTLTNPDYQLQNVSATFHGRDIFAPAAAFLARGMALERLGPAAINLVHPEHLRPPQSGQLPDTARIIHIDHFGNLVLNITDRHIDQPDATQFIIAQKIIPRLSRTFADVSHNELLAYVGSTGGHIEIAIRNGNAAHRLGVKTGDTVTVKRG